MAIFKKNEPQVQKPRERPAVSSRSQGDSAISIIGSGMQVVGDITTEGIVRVEGEVFGTIRAGTAVVLGQAGRIEGNVLTQDAVIGGQVSGSIVAANRLELQSTCVVEGEIQTRAEHLKLEEGARFAGQVQMLDETGSAPEARSEGDGRIPDAAGAAYRPEAESVGAYPTGADAAEANEGFETDLDSDADPGDAEIEEEAEEEGKRRKAGAR